MAKRKPPVTPPRTAENGQGTPTAQADDLVAAAGRGGLVPVVRQLADLRPHPRNYREHSDAQLEHIVQSIRDHGIYRPILTARDGATILAGHGVAAAARRMALVTVPTFPLDLDPFEPLALKVLIGDNQIAQLADIDDRGLVEMLKELHAAADITLLGSGYDAMQLAALALVSRPESEIADANEAAEWVGMPEYTTGARPYRIIVNCDTEAERDAFYKAVGAEPLNINRAVGGKTSAIWWPLRERRPPAAEIFEADS